MELDLSLGDASRPFGFTEKPREASNQLGLGFNTILSIGPIITKQSDHQHQQKQEEETAKHKHKNNSHSTTELEDHEATNDEYHISPPPPLKANNNTLLQLDLLPHTPAIAPINPPPNLSFSWHPPLEYAGGSCLRGLDANWLPAAVAVEDEAEEVAEFSSSPNSAASSFQLDLLIYSTRGGSVNGEGYDQMGCSSRASDEDENRRSTRKKLRLSKEQSTFLEESFKEHNTLNPKQKLALAKQLHLRPRQVEVWFQNRRARTKLKQTEVDYEYLKRCCETLNEENKRLHKELQELKALKTPNPFYMQLPATTLTMCPSCERVATNSTSIPSSVTTNTATATVKAINEQTSKAIGFSLSKPRFYPFLHTQPHPHQSTPS